MIRCHSSVAVVSMTSVFATTCGRVRRYGRGIPYAPEGTIQDFSCSPRHIGMEKLLKEKERALRRGGGNVDDIDFTRPLMTTSSGTRPMGYDTQQQQPFSGSSMRHIFSEAVATAGDQYQQDRRMDPQFSHLPGHIRSAQQSVIDMQSDCYGESIRGMVPPPPPVDPDAAPQAYTPPRVDVTAAWYVAISGFICVFCLMSRYGR